MSWVIYCKFWTHDRTDWHWKAVAICVDVESAGIVERALIFAGREVKVEKGV